MRGQRNNALPCAEKHSKQTTPPALRGFLKINRTYMNMRENNERNVNISTFSAHFQYKDRGLAFQQYGLYLINTTHIASHKCTANPASSIHSAGASGA
jgi:hypothetical protein